MRGEVAWDRVSGIAKGYHVGFFGPDMRAESKAILSTAANPHLLPLRRRFAVYAPHHPPDDGRCSLTHFLGPEKSQSVFDAICS